MKCFIATHEGLWFMYQERFMSEHSVEELRANKREVAKQIGIDFDPARYEKLRIDETQTPVVVLHKPKKQNVTTNL